MIIEYHRPQTLEEALQLLGREAPLTRPLAGGSAINRPSPDRFAVVDLQNLGLNAIEMTGSSLRIGATATLQSLLDYPDLSPSLKRVIQHEATYNLRQAASVAGTLVAADGRSPFATAMLALDASLKLVGFQAGNEQMGVGDLLPLRDERLRGKLITRVTLPLNAQLAYEYIARTPADLPIVCAAAARWPSGRTRVVLGGYGAAPMLAMDGPEPGGAEQAAQDSYSQAGDAWASADYRQEMAGVLTLRCLKVIER